MVRRRLCALAALVLLAACGDPDVELTTVRLRVAFPSDGSCRPETVTSLRVQALGDFPESDTTIELVDALGGAAAIDRFPTDTVLVTIEAIAPSAWGAGIMPIPPLAAPVETSSDIMLLPYGRSCRIGAVDDPLPFVPPGAALARLPGGGLLVAGGGEAGEDAPRRVVRLVAQSERFEERAMLQPRIGASATLAGGRVVVFGGARDARSTAEDTFEVYDPTTGDFVADRARTALRTPRREHGAALLPTGQILVAGGRESDDAPVLASAELLDPATGRVDELVADMHIARLRPSILVLDDSSVLVAGGLNQAGAEERTVELLTDDVFIPLPEVAVPDRPGAAIVALPGARVAWVGGGVAASASRNVFVLLPDLSWVDLPDVLPLALQDVRAVGLADGSIFVTGTHVPLPPMPPTPSVHAYVIDVGRASAVDVTRLPAVAPRELLALDDGSIAEISPDGAIWLRRESLRTVLDAPPATLLTGGAGGVALDTPDHWSERDGVLTANTDEARLDLPPLRFGSFVAELEATRAGGGASVDLLLIPESGLVQRVELREGLEVGPPLCKAPHVPGSALVVERHGDDVVVAGGADRRECRLPGLGERVGLAVVASRDTALPALRITRVDE